MASLDAARRQLAVHGELLLDRTIKAAARARDGDRARFPGCAIVGEQWVGRPGIAGWDPLRIVIDVRGTGLTGYQVASALRASYDIHVELATHATVVLVLGIGQPIEPLDRVAHDLAETVRRIRLTRVRSRWTGAGRSVLTQPPAELGPEPAVRAARRLPRRQRGGAGRRRRWGGSRLSRSPATRRACRRCCPASG